MMNFAIELGLFYLLVYFVLSGLDELSIDLRLGWYHWRRRGRGGEGQLPDPTELRRHPEQRIAILVPLWQESDVIRQMVETNLAQLEYSEYEFFLGVYPNDEATARVGDALASLHPRVNVVVCSRPGPTSKADCLNHLYRALDARERASGKNYDIVVLHDAEDVLHPLSLALMNWFCSSHGMVQVPVLPFPTPAGDWIHGVYCDEFAEFLGRDMVVRNEEGGFLPSNGVGTAFQRVYLEQLRETQSGVLFDDECLTEDYEIGLKLADIGCPQIFLPLTRQYGDLLATREYFPRCLSAAIRQRTRWISGQCLQSWKKHGWPLRPKLTYWFWRDRKGLWGNFLSFLALVLLVLTGIAWAMPEPTGLGPWLWVAGSIPAADILYPLCTLLTLERVAIRMLLVGHAYGFFFALSVPLRMPLSAWINVRATSAAISRFASAQFRRKRLGWLKTEHAFPMAAPAMAERQASSESQVFVTSQVAMSAAMGGSGESTGYGASGIFRSTPQGTLPNAEDSESLRRPSRAAPGDLKNVGSGCELRPLLFREGEVVLMIPRNMSPAQRRTLTKRTHARLVFIEEHEADSWLRANSPGSDPIAQAGD